ncbi:pecanex protein [Trichuris suis]|nr:pecanex protein [Trichuris suis]
MSLWLSFDRLDKERFLREVPQFASSSFKNVSAEKRYSPFTENKAYRIPLTLEFNLKRFVLIELRKLLITLYVKCIIYFAIKSNRITDWLQLESIIDVLDLVQYNPEYVDVDPTFCYQNDEDYDVKRNGISYESFCVVYLSWITCCADRSGKSLTEDTKYGNQVRKMVVALCYLLSLFGRRLLGAAAQSHTTNAESFLYGLHALFKQGDFRITCSRDEWVFSDIDILSGVVAPAVRMALKLHQDQFTYAEDFDDNVCLYNLINGEGSTVFISHENDPAWRDAVLSNTAKLLALRHVSEDGLDDFKIIMLNKRFVSFRVIKLNRECVRAFWAGQQQELVFLRNGNPERGSIQNARQVLRNIINSSADQPIGYPIYVSPLTTSYSETHPQLSGILGPADLFKAVSDKLNCGMSGSSAINTVDQGFCQRSCTLPTVAIELQHIKGRASSECSTLRRSNLSLPMIEEGRSMDSSLLRRSSTHPVDRSISAQMLIRSSRATVGCCQQCILSTAMQNRNSRVHLLCSKQCCAKSSAVTCEIPLLVGKVVACSYFYGSLDKPTMNPDDIKFAVPSPSQGIFKDECAFCYDSPEDKGGFCQRHLQDHVTLKKHFAFLNYVRERKELVPEEDGPPRQITKLAIGVEGGFMEKRYDVQEHWAVAVYPELTPLHLSESTLGPGLLYCCKKLMEAESAYRVLEVQSLAGTWDGTMLKDTIHTDLYQVPNPPKIPPSGWRCQKPGCDKTDNLWLNLSDGAIFCGRRYFDGTGGNNHSVDHFCNTAYPLAVKLGTISARGGDVFSYDEDDLVSRFSQHF